MKTLILIPALAPSVNLVGYVNRLSRCGLGRILVVNDGSKPECDAVFEMIKSSAGCEVISHEKNRGKGAALKTGFEYFCKMDDIDDYNGVIAADSDGQHTVEDIIKISQALEDSEQLILGVRDFSLDVVPPKSRIGNNMTRNIMKALYHVDISDTQTGLRGFPKCMMQRLLACSGERYEYETNMLIMCAEKKIPINEVPIQTVYYDNNAETHFHPVKDSFRIYRLFFGTFVKYLFSSLSAAVIDIVFFSILINTVFTADTKYIFVATAAARVISSLYNFLVNRRLVFASDSGLMSQAMKYYILVVVQMLCSALLVSLLTLLFKEVPTLNKIIVDLVLFFCSYYVQKRFIFKKKK